MKKRCPVCSKIYAEGALYCDRDRSALVALEPEGGQKPAWRRGPWIAAALVLAAAILVSIGLIAYVRQGLTAQIEKVVMPVANLGDSSLAMRAGTVGVFARLQNRMLVPIELTGGDYALLINHVQVVAGSVQPDGKRLSVASGGSTVVPLQTAIPATTIHAGAGESLKSGGLRITLRGTVRIRFLGAGFAVPVEASAPLKIQVKEGAPGARSLPPAGNHQVELAARIEGKVRRL